MWSQVSLQLMPPCLMAKATMPAATRKESSVRHEKRRDARGGAETWAASAASACGAGMRRPTVPGNRGGGTRRGRLAVGFGAARRPAHAADQRRLVLVAHLPAGPHLALGEHAH